MFDADDRAQIDAMAVVMASAGWDSIPVDDAPREWRESELRVAVRKGLKT